MKTLPSLILVLCTASIPSFGLGMERTNESNIATPSVERVHWSAQEIQSPLKSKKNKYSQFSPLEPSPFMFINTTSTDLDLSFYYQLECSNDSQLTFDKVTLTELFGGTYEYEDGKLIDVIELKATTDCHYITTYADWHQIEKSIKKILMKKKNYNRFKITLAIKCSKKEISDWINFSCSSFPILSLTTDSFPLKYHYTNRFHSIFVITQQPRHEDYLGNQLPLHIENHKIIDYLLSKRFSKDSLATALLFNWSLKTPNSSRGEIQIDRS